MEQKVGFLQGTGPEREAGCHLEMEREVVDAEHQEFIALAGQPHDGDAPDRSDGDGDGDDGDVTTEVLAYPVDARSGYQRGADRPGGAAKALLEVGNRVVLPVGGDAAEARKQQQQQHGEHRLGPEPDRLRREQQRQGGDGETRWRSDRGARPAGADQEGGSQSGGSDHRRGATRIGRHGPHQHRCEGEQAQNKMSG